jgi:putative oxidoreductase
MSKPETVVSWVLQIVVAVILFQTLFFKFTGAEESVYIFSTLGVEPWGRLVAGTMELVAVGLILYPPTVVYGALLSLAVITGALASHVKLGLVVKDDGGLLFVLAMSVFLASLAIVYLRRSEIPVLGERLFRTIA